MTRGQKASRLSVVILSAGLGSLGTVLFFQPWRHAKPTPAQAAASLYSGGLSALYGGKMRLAVRRFTDLIRLRPDDPKAYYFRGLAYRDLRSLPEAIADFTRAVELDPALSGARYLRALSRRELGDIRGALSDIEAVLADGRPRPELLQLKAALLVAVGRKRDALRELDAALELDPKSYFSLVKRGELRAGLKKDADADADFAAAIAEDDALAPAFVASATALMERSSWKEAEAAARQAIERLPGRADLHLLKGYINQRMFERDAALADYTAAIGLSPRSHLPLMRRGSLYMHIGSADEKPEKFQLGILDQTRAIQLAPKNPGPLRARSNLYTWTREYDKALEDAKAVLRLQPRAADSHDSLADAYRLMGKTEQSLAASEKAVELDPYDSQPRVTRCITLSEADRHKEALAECDLAVEYDPLSTEALFQRAKGRLRAGLRADAVADARRICEMDPSSARFRKLLKEATQVVSF